MSPGPVSQQSWLKYSRTKASLVALFALFTALSFYSASSERTEGGIRSVTNGAKAGSLRIYVYELSPELSSDVYAANHTQDWLMSTNEYDADLWTYKMLSESPLRTYNPEEANLFFIPILPTKFLHLSLARMNWQDAVRESVKYIERALAEIQLLGPFWKRSNGFDHFAVITADSARCIHLSGSPQATFGDMLFVMHHGDQHQYDFFGGEWPCYKPDRDIVIPAYLPEEELPRVPALRPEGRKPAILYRFSDQGPTAGHKTHHTYVRKELKRLHDIQPIPGADWRVRSLNDTIKDMAESVFCTCPSGVVGHTSRFYRALRLGCIPVTFFRGYDLPFQNKLDYSAFTLNIQPDSIPSMGWRTYEVLHNPKKLKAMQKALDKAQSAFSWKIQNPPIGVHARLLEALKERGDQAVVQRAYSKVVSLAG